MEIYIVDNLKTNILIDIDTLIFKGIIMNLYIKILIFGKYLRLQISLDIIIKLNPHFKRIIRFKSIIIIVLGITIKIPVTYNSNILYNRDFLFESNYI